MSSSIYHYTYLITNTTNQMKYIGVRSCSCLPENDDGYMGSSKILDEDMGIEPEAFTKTIIETFSTRETANADEQRLHEMYDVARNPLFYNLVNAPMGFCMSGKNHSPEARKKMSKSRSGDNHHMYGKHLSSETKKKISESNKGKTHTEETKKQMSESSKGKPCSEETRKKLSDSLKGKIFSPEHRKKISENNVGMKGKKHSPETRKKMKEASMRKNLSPETLSKMSKSQSGENNPMYGKSFSEEHKRKIGDAQKGVPQPKTTCPHCLKTGGESNMKRYHFNNCKEISTIF
jgi:hypothetical protein